MSSDLIIALSTFALVSSITPGPNNLMLMSSGATFGFKRTIPMMLGVAAGFIFMLIMVGIGLVQLFDSYPLMYQILKVFSISYIFYLAFKIATSLAPEDRSNKHTKPFSFLQAALFQWVNPKAWTMALTAMSIYSPTRDLDAILLVTIVFGLVNIPCASVWIILGQKLRRLLKNDSHLRLFNLAMAALLIMSVYPVLLN
ncbi:MAG: LysE family translocator [Alteromonadaceae bacterium]|jgi:threonine/homoserine/homoserine lactone efflux protein|tara:strand:- start:1305 stop:1901 length:597 start_codon:yes stop_codon:yes gene_type:complete